MLTSGIEGIKNWVGLKSEASLPKLQKKSVFALSEDQRSRGQRQLRDVGKAEPIGWASKVLIALKVFLIFIILGSVLYLYVDGLGVHFGFEGRVDGDRVGFKHLGWTIKPHNSPGLFDVDTFGYMFVSDWGSPEIKCALVDKDFLDKYKGSDIFDGKRCWLKFEPTDQSYKYLGFIPSLGRRKAFLRVPKEQNEIFNDLIRDLKSQNKSVYLLIEMKYGDPAKDEVRRRFEKKIEQ